MSRKYFKFLIIVLALAVIIPQVTLAAWWNPFSWHFGWINRVFHFQQTAQKAEKQISETSLNNIQLNAANPADPSKTDTFSFSSGRVLLNQGTANMVSYTLAKTAVGDLNGDGSQDGAVAAYQSYGANIIRVILFSAVNSNGKLAEADYVLPLTGQTMDAEIKSVSISSGTLTLNLVLVSAQDQQNLPHYQWKPTIEKTIQYKLVNGKLVEQPLAGGDVDSHGCIGSAGYTWCEAKQKCLRPWEETCGADQTVGWKTYTNTQYGFEIKYPQTWGYQEFDFNIEGIAFCPSEDIRGSGCGVTASATSSAVIILYPLSNSAAIGRNDADNHYWTNGKYTFYLHHEARANLQPIFGEMVSTFKFTK